MDKMMDVNHAVTHDVDLQTVNQIVTSPWRQTLPRWRVWWR